MTTLQPAEYPQAVLDLQATLELCPFCGSPARLVNLPAPDGLSEHDYWVAQCSTCTAEVGYWTIPDFEHPGAAAADWNTRTLPAGLLRRVAAFDPAIQAQFWQAVEAILNAMKMG